MLWILIDQNRALKEVLAAGTGGTASPAKVGDQLPSGSLLSLAGQDVPVGEIARGRPLVIAFLTTSCQYCSATLPVWSELAAAVPKAGAVFVAVAFDVPERVEAYRVANNLAWEIHMANTVSPVDFGVSSVPMTVVYDPSGRIVEIWRGTLQEPAIGEVVSTIRQLRNARP